MLEFFLPFTSGAVQFGWQDVVDILIVAAVIYALMRITKGTRAFQVLKGLGLIIIAAVIFGIFNFQTVSWILSWLVSASAVVMVILFQQEIRRALEKLGSSKFFGVSFAATENGEKIVTELTRAFTNLSMHKTGALVVIERKTGLLDIRETGIRINSEITSELVENIFYPNTPLHDGAMVIKDGRIAAAGCFLPLSNNREISSELGTRHRAALGVSEVSDSYTIVVSEETGTISYTYDGVMTRNIDSVKLRELLENVFMQENGTEEGKQPVFKFRRRIGGKK
jgi:diadenylate cyclase